MSEKFANLLTSYGFTADEDELQCAVTAFYHEIPNFLDDPTIFDLDQTVTLGQPENLGQMFLCDLVRTSTASQENAVAYFLKQWTECLRYKNNRHDIIEVSHRDEVSIIECLTVSQGHSACSFLFRIYPNVESKRDGPNSIANRNSNRETEHNLTPEQLEDMMQGMNATFDDPEFSEKFERSREQHRKKMEEWKERAGIPKNT